MVYKVHLFNERQNRENEINEDKWEARLKLHWLKRWANCELTLFGYLCGTLRRWKLTLGEKWGISYLSGECYFVSIILRSNYFSKNGEIGILLDTAYIQSKITLYVAELIKLIWFESINCRCYLITNYILFISAKDMLICK